MAFWLSVSHARAANGEAENDEEGPQQEKREKGTEKRVDAPNGAPIQLPLHLNLISGRRLRKQRGCFGFPFSRSHRLDYNFPFAR